MPGAAIGAFLGWMFTGWGSIGAMTTFLGMQMSVLSVIMLGASIGSLFDQVDLGDIGSTPNYAFGQLANTKSQLLPVPIVYGKCKVAGNVFLQQYYDDTQTKVDMFVGISEGPIHSIKEIYANDVQLTDDSGTWVATTKTECSHNVHLGAADQTVDSREPDGVTNYGNTAYIALTLRADSDLSGNPTITSIVEGREVWTPTGTMYTRNPAWCIYDFLTNTRYGVGIPAGLIDLDSFETVAAYCDSSDGGEVRYTLDYIIDTQQPAIDHLQAMLSTFNGYFSCREKIELHCDMPVVAAYKSLDEDNFIKGSFSWWQKPDEDVCNRVVIEWVDPDNSYERVSASFPTIEDVADQTRRGVIEQKFTLLGVTRASQVGRLGQYLYDTGRLLRNFCSFGLSLQDADIDAGDVIEISYTSFTGWNKKKFRVLKIEDAGDDTIKCSCVEYDPDVFDNDAYVTPVITPDTPPVNHDDVYGLTLSDVGHVNDDGTWVPIVRAEWQNPSSFTPSSIRVYYQHNTETDGDEEPFVLATESGALITQYDMAGLQTDQTYTIKITCMKSGAETTGVSAQIVVGKDTTPPGAVTGLTALGWFGSIWLNWINPVDPDWSYTEIWENTIDQRDGEGGAVKIANVAGTSFERYVGSFQGRYYWARAVDMSGNAGPWNAEAGVYGYSDQESHQDFVDRLFEQSEYLQRIEDDLNTGIDSIAESAIEESLSSYQDATFASLTDRKLEAMAEAALLESFSGYEDWKHSYALIRTEQTIREDEDETLASQITTIAAMLGDPENPGPDTVYAAIVEERMARAARDGALATSIDNLVAHIGDPNNPGTGTVFAAINAAKTASATADEALASDIETLGAAIGDPDGTDAGTVYAAIKTEQTARAAADTTIASKITTLQTKVDGHTTSIQQVMSSVDGIEGKYALRIDSNGYITGWELIGGPSEGSMILHVDNFLVGRPGAAREYPFVIGTVDGVTKISMSNTFIQDAAISSAKIKDLSVGTLKIAGEAVSSVAASTAGNEYTISGTDGYKTVMSATPTCMAGFPVLITFNASAYVYENTSYLRLLRNGAVIGGQSDITVAAFGDNAHFGISYGYKDTAPWNGPVTYTIQIKVGGSWQYTRLYSRCMTALHVKR